jgi:hypothetical protein
MLDLRKGLTKEKERFDKLINIYEEKQIKFKEETITLLFYFVC